MMRLQKYLAQCGVASRRAAEQMIQGGDVTVNGRIVTELGTQIEAGHDIVCCRGTKAVPQTKHIYVMLYKPESYVTTVKDQFGRPTVLDLVRKVEQEMNVRLVPVGRLDYDTSGLLLLTNDGDFTYRFTHPRHQIEKQYSARITGIPSEYEMERFRNGLIIDGHRTAPAKITLVRTDQTHSVVCISITEGRNRQVRKMCEEIGHPVVSLKRTAVGCLTLGKLKKGGYRLLEQYEVERIMQKS